MSAQPLTDDVLKAARRLGLKADEITITGTVARARVDLTQTLKFGHTATLKEFLRSRGACSAILESGQIVNPELADLLYKAAREGKRFMGGNVRLAREVPNLVPGQPPVPVFEITFPRL